MSSEILPVPVWLSYVVWHTTVGSVLVLSGSLMQVYLCVAALQAATLHNQLTKRIESELCCYVNARNGPGSTVVNYTCSLSRRLAAGSSSLSYIGCRNAGPALGMFEVFGRTGPPILGAANFGKKFFLLIYYHWR
jgi:hypothetical protein